MQHRLLRFLRDAARTGVVWLLNRLPDGLILGIREGVLLRRPLDYSRTQLQLEIDSAEEYHVRLLSCTKEPETVEWLEANLRAGDVFYDIGANVGAYSLVAAAYGGPSVRVYAFEPNSATFAKLCRNIDLNGFHAQITALPVALSAESGLASFRYASGRPGLASHSVIDGAGLRQPTEFEAGGVQTVLMAPLDEMIRRYRLAEPDLIKIDVDGGELGVLTGARDVLLGRSVRAVLLEVDDTLQSADEIFRILNAAGFALAASVQRPAVVNHMFVRAVAARK